MKSNNVLRFDFGGYRFDHHGSVLKRDGYEKALTRKSADLLLVLIQSSHRALSKDELLRAVWNDRYVEESTLTQHIYMLRQALGDQGKSIRTVPKLGYQFVGEAKPVSYDEIEEVMVEEIEPYRSFSGIRNWFDLRKRVLAVSAALVVVVLSALLILRSDSALPSEATDHESRSQLSGLSENAPARDAYMQGLVNWDAMTEESLLAAIPHFERAIELDPQFTTAYADLADTYALIAHFEISSIPKAEALAKAGELAAKAQAIDPNDSSVRTSLALIAASNNKVNESFALLDEAIRANRANAVPYQRVAWLFASIDQNDKALEYMATAYRIAPKSRSIAYGMVTLLNLARRPVESMEYSRRLLESDEKNFLVRIKLAESFEQIADYELALAELNKIPASEAAYVEAQIVRSRLLAKSNRGREARSVLRKAIAKPRSSKLGYQIALTFAAMGSPDSATPFLTKRPRRDPNLHTFDFVDSQS